MIAEYILKESSFETHASFLEVKVSGTFHFALRWERGVQKADCPKVTELWWPLPDSHEGIKRARNRLEEVSGGKITPWWNYPVLLKCV